MKFRAEAMRFRAVLFPAFLRLPIPFRAKTIRFRAILPPRCGGIPPLHVGKLPPKWGEAPGFLAFPPDFVSDFPHLPQNAAPFPLAVGLCLSPLQTHVRPVQSCRWVRFRQLHPRRPAGNFPARIRVGFRCPVSKKPARSRVGFPPSPGTSQPRCFSSQNAARNSVGPSGSGSKNHARFRVGFFADRSSGQRRLRSLPVPLRRRQTVHLPESR